jgi:hypothetical protein
MITVHEKIYLESEIYFREAIVNKSWICVEG